MSTRGIRREHREAIAERKARVLRLLMEADGQPVRKPADMPQEHWSYAIDRLRLEGYVIIPVPNKGMSLVESPQSAAEPQTPTEPPEAPQAPETGSGEATEGESFGSVPDSEPPSQLRDYLASPRPPELGGVDVIREPDTPTRQGDVIVQAFVPFAGQTLEEPKYADPDELIVMRDFRQLTPSARYRFLNWANDWAGDMDIKVGLNDEDEERR